MGTLIAAFLVRVIVQPWWVCKVSKLHYAHYMRFWARTMVQSIVFDGRCYSSLGLGVASKLSITDRFGDSCFDRI